MSRADPQARDAAGTDVVDAKGKLNATGGRTEKQTARPPLPSVPYRLKRSVQLFPAPDGSLHLVRSGSGEGDFVLPAPTQRDRRFLELLAGGFVTEAELEDGLAARGLAADDVAGSLAQLDELGVLERAAGPELLSPEQRERYDRQLIYFSDLAAPGVPAERLQRRLQGATVVVLGCGGLGSWTACGLACAGVGSLVLIDDDRVELSNLNRQLLFTEADLGQLKVDAAARALAAHNSEIELIRIPRRMREPADLATVVADVDLLISTADWPPYELPRWVNAACLEAKVPYISAGQSPPLVRVGPMVLPGDSACLECQETHARGNFPLYDEFAAFRARRPSPEATLGPASGLVGSMLAMEALHLLTGAHEPATVGCALIMDLRTMQVERQEIPRDPTCRACAQSSQIRTSAPAAASS